MSDAIEAALADAQAAVPSISREDIATAVAAFLRGLPVDFDATIGQGGVESVTLPFSEDWGMLAAAVATAAPVRLPPLP